MKIADVRAYPTSFPLIEDRAITILQPDLAKTGGVTEGVRIAALAFLAAIENAGYFEADVSKGNLFRDRLTSTPYVLGKDGCVRPLETPGIGVAVDEDFLVKHPVIEGPSYV